MGLPFAPPQGYPGGGLPIKVATGSILSSASVGTFTTVAGTAVTTLYTLTIAVPSAAAVLVAVSWSSTGSTADIGFATPMGNAGGAGATSIMLEDIQAFEAGGDLVLALSGCTVAAYYASATYSFSVYYQ